MTRTTLHGWTFSEEYSFWKVLQHYPKELVLGLLGVLQVLEEYRVQFKGWPPERLTNLKFSLASQGQSNMVFLQVYCMMIYYKQRVGYDVYWRMLASTVLGCITAARAVCLFERDTCLLEGCSFPRIYFVLVFSMRVFEICHRTSAVSVYLALCPREAVAWAHVILAECVLIVWGTRHTLVRIESLPFLKDTNPCKQKVNAFGFELTINQSYRAMHVQRFADAFPEAIRPYGFFYGFRISNAMLSALVLAFLLDENEFVFAEKIVIVTSIMGSALIVVLLFYPIRRLARFVNESKSPVRKLNRSFEGSVFTRNSDAKLNESNSMADDASTADDILFAVPGELGDSSTDHSGMGTAGSN